jgi:hypothetical protein
MSEVYKVVIFEERNWDHFRGTIWQIKRLLEGTKFPVDVKCKGPVLMVSNEGPIMDEAVCSGLRVMEAFDRYDEGKDEVD